MSSRRSTRKRKVPAAPTADVSSSWYVGYAEDGESVEAIMQKFQELERMQVELAAPVSSTPTTTTSSTLSIPSTTATTTTATSHPQSTNHPISDPLPPGGARNGDPPTEDLMDVDEAIPATEFTQEQLEELFKRTSGFTVKQAALNLDAGDLDDMELWRMEMEGLEDGNEWGEEDDQFEDPDDEFWGEEARKQFSTVKKTIRVARIKPQRASTGSRLDRESLIARYKVQQIQMQDRNGNFFVMKKRVAAVDPRLPTYVRIPPVPVPRAWVKIIEPYKPPRKEVVGCRYHKGDILKFHLPSLGNRFQVVHMDPPLLLPNEPLTPGKITIDELASLDIPSIIPCGFLFVWAEKELTPHILRITQSWGFRYVENFAWIKRERDNRIAQQPARYFNKSKTTCFIFRKEMKTGDVELRHQRSPDCEFDFIKPLVSGTVTEEKPGFIYNVIETLLPQAVHSKTEPNGDRMLDLWAPPGRPRVGWTILEQTRDT
ncbi:hypothetical protein HKX48_009188 [Thoreauomyces humboldtii]|nr:hypothetical protein HKX48_009188 [Thoreauomyces humboldtii]